MNSTKHLKKEWCQFYTNSSRKLTRREDFPFMSQAKIILVLKPGEDITKNRNFRQMIHLLKFHTKTILSYWIQQYIKKLMHHAKWDLSEETSQVSFNRCTVKQTMVHSYHGIYSTIKKNRLFTQATTWVNLQRIMLSGEKSNHPPNLHVVWFHVDSVLEITNV